MFQLWLEKYKKAWEEMNNAVLYEIFSKDATYKERPFSAPYRGIEGIIEYWNDIKQRQSQVSFAYEILSDTQIHGIAHWNASFTEKQTGVNVMLDGIMIAKFDDSGRCKSFSEWWHSSKKPESKAC